jgi:HEPN domain-containing protein
MTLCGPREEIDAWLAKARQDLEVARLVLPHASLAALGGFHCQQAVEKCLKACLAAAGEPVPKVHDLVALAASARHALPDLSIEEAGLSQLSVYAVAPRYPGFADDQACVDLPGLVAFAEATLEHVTRLVLAPLAP